MPPINAKTICLLLLFIAGYTSSVKSQKSEPTVKLMAGYFGETLTHSGFSSCIEYSPYHSSKYQMILAANLGGYVHKRNNTSIFIRTQWGQRITFNNGFFMDEFMGIGYLHQFTHGGVNYEILPNGGVIKVRNSGRPMVMPSVALGIGYDLSKKTKQQLACFIRPELFWKAPFNGYYLTHFSINIGMLFKLSK